MSDIPFIAASNEELEDAPPIKAGDVIKCQRCAGMHAIEAGTGSDGQVSELLLFYSCQGTTYLAGIAGKSIVGRRFGQPK